ncbi:unnamed protein product [Rotaria sordida]|uniref:Uncharacterized protein n=2 Tax=Rotaria sordida TaxID=392033 RepID=A0A815H3K4_9BILA|nr:unnamed protein product [Rotaria sordida]
MSGSNAQAGWYEPVSQIQVLIKLQSNQVMVKGIIPGNRSIINMKQNEFDIDGNDQKNQLSSMKCFYPSMRAIIQARLDNIEQRAQQIIKFIHAWSQ